jgi:hypothetical protein
MSDSLDTKMMLAADNHSKITGFYYGVYFTGIAESSRQNTCNYREMLTVELDKPIMKPGNYMDGGCIILWASMIEQGYYSIKTIDGNKI